MSRFLYTFYTIFQWLKGLANDSKQTSEKKTKGKNEKLHCFTRDSVCVCVWSVAEFIFSEMVLFPHLFMHEAQFHFKCFTVSFMIVYMCRSGERVCAVIAGDTNRFIWLFFFLFRMIRSFNWIYKLSNELENFSSAYFLKHAFRFVCLLLLLLLFFSTVYDKIHSISINCLAIFSSSVYGASYCNTIVFPT